MTAQPPLRVVQWTTGNVARATVQAILRRTDLELVGCYAWSPDKVGQDVATLCRLPETCGVTATDDVDALLALRPDCVVYTPLRFDVPTVERILRSGANVVTTAEFLTGHSIAGAREALAAAAEAGGASLFGSGMNPGYAQLLAAVATGICSEVRHVRSVESVDVSSFAGDSNMDGLGWGRPLDDAGHADDIRAAVAVFEDGVHVLADCLGVDLDRVDCRVDVSAAVRDLDLVGRPIAAGTVAGMDVRFLGVAGGREVIELHQRWVMSGELDPPMPAEHGYKIEIDGSPQVSLTLGLLPDQPLETLTVEDMHGIGMTITGMPVVHAIPHVVAARPGLVSYADIPTPAARM
ncbi:NAD(P)H-dependent amine dehydrogenase family protein [Nocardioides stalactiti]|uniref:NAD(P)H-dependent amine dehydrogenase family protein n=1 Tax=Nocardioides stalactiti TaxID=2755356 RepID=UPI0016032AD0|nr:dihydrodipicolinate reductase [Nocardioides stalactiti]